MSKTKDQTKNEYRKTDVNVELLLIIKSPPFLKDGPTISTHFAICASCDKIKSKD